MGEIGEAVTLDELDAFRDDLLEQNRAGKETPILWKVESAARNFFAGEIEQKVRPFLESESAASEAFRSALSAMRTLREEANQMPKGQPRALLHFAADHIEIMAALLVVNDLMRDELP